MSNFDDWNILKQKVNTKKNIFYFQEGQIWWMHLGINIGTEIYGKGKEFLRPCLIIKKASFQKAFVIPLSTQQKKQNYIVTDSQKIKQSVIFQEAKYIDTKRLLRKKSRITDKQLNKIKNKFLLHIRPK